jgi:hypothetical protein
MGGGTCANAADPIDDVVRKLNAICKSATFDLALSVGQLVVASFYDGDVEQLRERGRNKHVSLRKLARHPALPVSAGVLYRSIAIYELCEKLGVRSWQHICVSHLRLVLSLPFEDQERLLRLAEANGWSVQMLDEEVAVARRRLGSRSRGGRPRQSPLRRTISSVQKCVALLDAAVARPDDEESASSSVDSVREMADVLQDAMRACETLQDRVVRMMARAEDRPSPPRESHRGLEAKEALAASKRRR